MNFTHLVTTLIGTQMITQNVSLMKYCEKIQVQYAKTE